MQDSRDAVDGFFFSFSSFLHASRVTGADSSGTRHPLVGLEGDLSGPWGLGGGWVDYSPSQLNGEELGCSPAEQNEPSATHLLGNEELRSSGFVEI